MTRGDNNPVGEIILYEREDGHPRGNYPEIPDSSIRR
jgi:hypothetical protein